MNLGAWRFAAASVIGTSHQRNGTECQDANRCVAVTDSNGEQIFVGIVSDGAGSAQCGGIGAQSFCSFALGRLTETLAHSTIQDITGATIEELLSSFQEDLRGRARLENRVLRDYACTCLGAIVSQNSAVFFQVGDGCIVIRNAAEEDYEWVFWPERGEYENLTFFITADDALEYLRFSAASGTVNEIAIFTDGLQRLALDLQLQIPHAGFFRAMFSPLQSAEEGLSQELASSLAGFLASDRVNNRTDDDKTLILASRDFVNGTDL